jgi:hypothetical protein
VPVFPFRPSLTDKRRKWVHHLKSFGGDIKNSYRTLQSGFGLFPMQSSGSTETSRWYVSRLYLGGTLYLLETGIDQIPTKYFLESDGHRGYFSFFEFKKKLMSFSRNYDCICPHDHALNTSRRSIGICFISVAM